MNKKFATISKFLLIFVLIFAWMFSGWPRIWEKPAIPPEVQEARADTATNSPSSNSGSAWTNPTNAYADASDAATQTSGNGANIYSGYGFNLGNSNITQVRVKTDAWSTPISTIISNNPTANTNGTYPWTNPANGYTSNNSYATAVATIPTYRSTGAMAHGTTGPITPGLPAGMSANDIVILVLARLQAAQLLLPQTEVSLLGLP